MATISPTSIPSIQTQSSNRASEGSDVASQIARISQQIIKLTQQIKEIADTSGSAEDKQKQAELIQQQITLLETQLAQLQRQQAEKAQEKEQRLSLNASLPNPVEKRLRSIFISDTADPSRPAIRARPWPRTTSHNACAAVESERFFLRTSINWRSTTGVMRFTTSGLPSGNGSASAGRILMPMPAATIGNSVAGCPISCTIFA